MDGSQELLDGSPERAASTNPCGPEIVLVLAGVCDGWLESKLMEGKRAWLVERLRRHEAAATRLRIYEPRRGRGEASEPIYVHAKLAIVDDARVVLGSANLCNRSFGLDSELDVVLETSGATSRRRPPLRAQRLADHDDRGLLKPRRPAAARAGC